jgi:hypothetical protein
MFMRVHTATWQDDDEYGNGSGLGVGRKEVGKVYTTEYGATRNTTTDVSVMSLSCHCHVSSV